MVCLMSAYLNCSENSWLSTSAVLLGYNDTRSSLYGWINVKVAANRRGKTNLVKKCTKQEINNN